MRRALPFLLLFTLYFSPGGGPGCCSFGDISQNDERSDVIHLQSFFLEYRAERYNLRARQILRNLGFAWRVWRVANANTKQNVPTPYSSDRRGPNYTRLKLLLSERLKKYWWRRKKKFFLPGINLRLLNRYLSSPVLTKSSVCNSVAMFPVSASCK